MKQALKEARTIIEMEKIVRNTTAKKFRRDMIKGIIRRKRDLQEYCQYKNLNYSEIMKEAYKND